MTAAGHHLRRLTHLAFSTLPDFSPDGQRLAFDARTTADGPDEIFVVHADGRHLHRLTNAGNNDYPAWSPDGRRLAFVSDRTGVRQVYTMRADGAAQTQLTFQPVPHGQLPDWRPDGRRIAYTEGDQGAEKIWVMNANGARQHQVSTGATDDLGPVWSPTGQQLAFVRIYSNDHRVVTVMNADGSDARSVIDPSGTAAQYVPAWQPRCH